MKYFVISDIHGSYHYLNIAIDKFNASDCDYLLILGDILNHGPRNPLPKGYNPSKCIKLLNSIKHKTIAIKGNCDSDVDEMCLDFKLTEYNTLIHKGKKIFMHHGHIVEADETLSKGDSFIQGHTHLVVAENRNGINYLNPGSLSLPKGGFPNSYAIIDSCFTVFDLEDNQVISLNL